MLKCKHCGTTTTKTGKPFPHKGALNLHENIHCPKRSGGAAQEEESCCENPSIRFLSKADKNEALALTKGYKKICDNCLEVYE